MPHPALTSFRTPPDSSKFFAHVRSGRNVDVGVRAGVSARAGGEVETVWRAIRVRTVREETGRRCRRTFGTEEGGTNGDFRGGVDVRAGESIVALTWKQKVHA